MWSEFRNPFYSIQAELVICTCISIFQSIIQYRARSVFFIYSGDFCSYFCPKSGCHLFPDLGVQAMASGGRWTLIFNTFLASIRYGDWPEKLDSVRTVYRILGEKITSVGNGGFHYCMLVFKGIQYYFSLISLSKRGYNFAMKSKL